VVWRVAPSFFWILASGFSIPPGPGVFNGVGAFADLLKTPPSTPTETQLGGVF